jgi:hypothetical protein
MIKTSPQRFRTEDTKLALTKDYRTVMEIVDTLWQGRVIERGGGFCLSMADMIRTLLLQKGIKSRLVECKLTVMSRNPPALTLIGHDNLIDRTGDINEMDVHVVCVTDTEIPMLIDLSIMHLRANTPYVVERAQFQDDHTLAEYRWGEDLWTYQLKPVSQLPQIYQQSIVDRMQTDRRVFKSIRTISILVSAALLFSGTNMIRGAYDFYQTYIESANTWGPDHNQRVLERLERIEQQLPKR